MRPRLLPPPLLSRNVRAQILQMLPRFKAHSTSPRHGVCSSSRYPHQAGRGRWRKLVQFPSSVRFAPQCVQTNRRSCSAWLTIAAFAQRGHTTSTRPVNDPSHLFSPRKRVGDRGVSITAIKRLSIHRSTSSSWRITLTSSASASDPSAACKYTARSFPSPIHAPAPTPAPLPHSPHSPQSPAPPPACSPPHATPCC